MNRRCKLIWRRGSAALPTASLTGNRGRAALLRRLLMAFGH